MVALSQAFSSEWCLGYLPQLGAWVRAPGMGVSPGYGCEPGCDGSVWEQLDYSIAAWEQMGQEKQTGPGHGALECCNESLDLICCRKRVSRKGFLVSSTPLRLAAWVQVPALPLSSCVVLRQMPYLSVPQFNHPLNGMMYFIT